jgi:histidinol-phosphatase
MLALAHRCWRFRGVGDFWQYVLVAEGAVDIAMDPIVNLWDVAALVPIIDEAGGRWSTIDGRDDVNGGDFVCTNGPLHDTVLAALA